MIPTFGDTTRKPAHRGGLHRHMGAVSLCVAVIASACGALGAGCTGAVGDGQQGGGGQGGSGNPANPGGGSGGGSGGGVGSGGVGGTSTPGARLASVGRGLRRLSRREYNNVVHDLLGDTTQPANQFAAEVYTNGYDNGPDSLVVQTTDDFATAAQALATTATNASNLSVLIGTCNPQGNEQACVSAFMSTFVLKAYRRPPSAGEQQRLQTVYAAGAAGGGGFKGGLELMLEAVLQSPSFLYREELGAPDPALPATVVRLTDYEVASELSFLLTGSIPDATLFTAVQNGTLKTSDDFRRETTRLLGSPAPRPAFRAFFNQWMDTTTVAGLTKDPMIYPTLTATPALAISMAGELNQFFDQVLWSGTGSLREFFTSTQGFVDSNLATLVYKINAPAGTGLQSVQLDGQIRKGILTRAGFLAANSDEDSSGPVPRGVFVMQNLLCAPPSPPPPNVPLPPPVAVAAQQHLTTRQRFDNHLTAPFCASCHSIIDGIGYGFEEFDALGVYRTTENGTMVDPGGNLKIGDIQGTFVGTSQLEDKLLQSKDVLSCVMKQVYRYSMGQEECLAPACASDASNGLLAAMQTGFTADSHLTDAFMTLLAAPEFVLRTTAQTH
jgi:hypothetical protein